MNSRIVDAVFTALKTAEELASSNAKILRGFRRIVQLDGFSCGARSVQAILSYYGIYRSSRTIERKFRTTWEGTDASDIVKVLRSCGLVVRTYREMGLREIRKAIDNEYPIIVMLFDGWHWSVCYGYSQDHIFLMNPSINFLIMGSIFCAVRKDRFRKQWDRWALGVKT